MFADLINNETQYIVWTLPEELPITNLKTEQNKAKHIKIRNFLETTEYILHLPENLLSEEILFNITEFNTICKDKSKKFEKKIFDIFSQKKDGKNIKFFSWKNNPKSIKEILFKIDYSTTYLKPIIYLSDTVGGPVITPHSEDLSQLFKKIEISPQVANKDDPLEFVCSVCLSKRKNTVYFPCHHMTCCSECANQCSVCPICRKEIKNKIVVFL